MCNDTLLDFFNTDSRTQYIQLTEEELNEIEYDHLQQAINESVKEYMENNGKFLNQTGKYITELLVCFCLVGT